MTNTTAKEQRIVCASLVEQLKDFIIATDEAKKVYSNAQDAETAFRRKLDAAHREYSWLLNSERKK